MNKEPPLIVRDKYIYVNRPPHANTPSLLGSGGIRRTLSAAHSQSKWHWASPRRSDTSILFASVMGEELNIIFFEIFYLFAISSVECCMCHMVGLLAKIKGSTLLFAWSDIYTLPCLIHLTGMCTPITSLSVRTAWQPSVILVHPLHTSVSLISGASSKPWRFVRLAYSSKIYQPK